MSPNGTTTSKFQIPGSPKQSRRVHHLRVEEAAVRADGASLRDGLTNMEGIMETRLRQSVKALFQGRI
jgi:hypothetical protein